MLTNLLFCFQVSNKSQPTVLEVLEQNPQNFSYFLKLVKKFGLEQVVVVLLLNFVMIKSKVLSYFN